MPAPLLDGAVGHYRTNHRCAIVALQAANSRLFEVRNTSATLLVVPTNLTISWIAVGAHTAAIEDSLDVFKCTGFTAVDTTNTVTPTSSVKRVSQAASTAAALRGVTVAGASAGMTGGTLTKDSNSIGSLPQWLLATLPTAGIFGPMVQSDFIDPEDASPFVFVQNEGLIVENRVLLGAAAASSVYIDFAWSEIGSL